MKIGLDARVFRSAKSGGIGKYVLNLLENIPLIESNHEIVLFEDSRYPDTFIPKFPRVAHRRFSIKGDSLFLWEQLALPWEIEKSKVDVFHSPGNTLPLMQPRPMVVTLHDTLLMESDEDETDSFLFYTRKIIPLALKMAKRIITVSENSKNDILKHFKIKENKISVIYHGIEPSYRKMENKELINSTLNNFGINCKYIFALGSLGPRKNTIKVIEVFSLLKNKSDRGLKLVIAGLRPDALRVFSDLVKNKELEDNVILLGHISENDLICLYNGAELFYYVSLYEGFGFPVVEAMACGCPVIASNVSSIPELVSEKNFLVNPKDTYDILVKTEILLDNDNIRLCAIKNGLEKSKEFNWKKTAEKTLNIYKQSLGG